MGESVKKSETSPIFPNPIEMLHPRSLKFYSHRLQSLIKGKLWLKVVIGLVLGILVGLLLSPTFSFVDSSTSSIIVEWLAVPGIIFLGLIQLIVIPLIFASIIRGIAGSGSTKELKRVGLAAMIFFLVTTILAVVIGIVVTNIIHPGEYIDSSTIEVPDLELNDKVSVEEFSLKKVPSKIGNLLSSNIFGSIINNEMLQIVIFSIIIGIALVSINVRQSKPLIELFGSIQDVSLIVVKWAMVLAPFAVFGLMAKVVSQVGLKTLFGLGIYVLTVMAGLLILFSFYLIFLFFTVGITPLAFLVGSKDALLLAFSTSSSAAVMPVSIKTAEEKLKVRPSIAQLIIPLGATINMNGTALYQTVATLFLAQVFGIELSLPALVLLIITIVGASIGSPAAPGVGIAILAVVLESVGIPITGIALIIGVDRILDMSRTAVNVGGDLTTCAFVDKYIGGEKTTKQQISERKKHERQRRQSGDDVLIKKV